MSLIWKSSTGNHSGNYTGPHPRPKYILKCLVGYKFITTSYEDEIRFKKSQEGLCQETCPKS